MRYQVGTKPWYQQENPTQISPNSSVLHLDEDVNLSLTHGSPQPGSVTRSICFVQWVQKKKKIQISKLKIKCRKLVESNGKKIVVIFIFLCMHFILFAMFEEKKIQISKFKKKKMEIFWGYNFLILSSWAEIELSL